MKRSDEICQGEKSNCGEAAAARRLSGPSICALTAAEKKILACVSLAKTNKEIACELRISPATVKRHLENILRKLGLRNRVEAAIFGLVLGGCGPEVSAVCPLHKWWNNRLATTRESWAI